MYWKFIFALLLVPCALFSEILFNVPKETSTVLLAILARNKAHTLPTYLKCIDNLDYDKRKIHVYINTNNNIDTTEEILVRWAQEHKNEYASIEIETHNITELSSDRPHDWNAKRFKALAFIRNKSVAKSIGKNADFYFVVDCDNFIAPYTLSYLVAKNKPIIAPLLRSIPEPGDVYSNYFCAVSNTGYYEGHPDYIKIYYGVKRGTFEVPVVHCTYLVKSDVLPLINYIDGTEDYEFVIFSRRARQMQIPQFICNEYPFGSLLHFKTDLSLEEEKARFNTVLASGMNLINPKLPTCQEVFTSIYRNKIWGENQEGCGYSGPGSCLDQTVKYREFLQKFLSDHQIKSVVDMGCGDWTFSRAIDWTGVEYKGFDVADEIVKKNIQLYGSSSIKFEVADGTQQNALPAADLLICKEVLQHLPFSDIENFIKNLDKYKYCLITNDVNPTGETTTNYDVERGGYRCLDLTAPPFCLEAEIVLTYNADPFLKQVILVKSPAAKMQDQKSG